MVKQCNGQCDPECQEDKKSVYICLKSEGHFLSSLLRLGHDEQGKQNLLGYDSSGLIDWYLYAKRSFASRSTGDPFGFGLKLLDELGKVLFGVTHVTVKPLQVKDDKKTTLLRPPEQKLVDAFLKSDFSGEAGTPQFISTNTKENNTDYDKEVQSVLSLCSKASEKLKNDMDIDVIREEYVGTLECRISFTKIQEIVVFRWSEYQTHVLLILRSLFDDENTSNRETVDLLRSARLKLACAYLHGVARFALSSSISSDNTSADNFGYWLDQGVSVDDGDGVQDNTSSLPSSSGANQTHAHVPLPRDTKVRISCELAASLAQEYWKSLNKRNDNALFDVLFMCKEEDGWFWVLTDSQLKHLQENVWRGNTTNLEKALEQFRFKHAGIIKHLERTECLIEEVYDFNKEELICTAVGYQLESSRKVFRDFKSFENNLPGVNTSSYFYFRLSSHEKKNNKNKFLPEGSLVAIFRFDRKMKLATRVGPMALVRQLVERWRAKMDSLGTVTGVVRELSRPFQEKTARAAIMSRNLSHNIGSHALANSRMCKAIGVLDKEPSAPETDRENDTYDEARGEVTRGQVWRARSRLSVLHTYLQGRMDFIARAMGESSSQPEPMFFLNDLVKGFLEQSILLNTLLSDNGYTEPDLEFTVSIKRGDESPFQSATYKACPKEGQEDRHAIFQTDVPIDDVLVAVPGGMVGRHAFYAFMENHMRNAAKYCIKQDKFRINFLLEDCPEECGAYRRGDSSDKRFACYTLTVTDNLSVGEREKIVETAGEIRGYLEKDIIDGKGETRSEGHGIQEMKVCAQFLAGGERDALVFPADDEMGKNHPLGNAYAGNGLKEAKGRHSLACFVTGDEAQGETSLAYGLLLQQPRLLGIVRADADVEGLELRVVDKEPTVTFCRDIESLAKYPAHFGLILLQNTEKDSIKGMLEEKISQKHTALPFRLILVINDEDKNQIKNIQNIVDATQEEWANSWWNNQEENNLSADPFPLPYHRVRVIGCPELFSDEVEEWEKETWQDLILTIYDKWLYAYKGYELQNVDDKQWHLGIGFERDRETVKKNWNISGQKTDSSTAVNLGFKANHLQLHVFAFQKGDEKKDKLPVTYHFQNGKEMDNKELSDISNHKEALLALDNHGSVIAGQQEDDELLKDCIASYHPFSGSEQIALFQMLETPPDNTFSRGFMIFSIAEALLTRVVVVDERVAEATLEKQDDDWFASSSKIALKFQKARIYPLYSVCSQRMDKDSLIDEQYFLTERLKDVLEEEARESGISVKDEGLHIKPIRPICDDSDGGCVQVVFGERVDEDGKIGWTDMSGEPVYPDFIVIHEGVTDSLVKKKLWSEGAHEELYSCCTRIVRTSGRGSISRHLGNELPFLEFSDLSDTTYRQMNKVALVKGLLSLCGNEVGGE